MADFILPGYETTIGNKKYAILDHTGPSSYVNPGGETMKGFGLNWGGFDNVNIGNSLSGTYSGKFTPTGTPRGQAFQTGVMRFYVNSTGAEVANAVDLSGELFRIECVGV